MKKKFCFGNWKMHKTPKEAERFLQTFSSLSSEDSKEKFAIFPSPILSGVFQKKDSDKNLNWGGQNCHFEKQGAFTGETSAFVLKEMGATYSLIGHSERRHIFGETDELLNKKTQTALEAGLAPVFCIGETEGEFDKKETLEVLKKQIAVGLNGVEASKVIVAYEPVWAIGTGKAATPDIVNSVHTELRELLPKTALLYGGSVKPANAKELYSINDVDGFLIGGASLEAESFCQIFSEMS